MVKAEQKANSGSEQKANLKDEQIAKMAAEKPENDDHTPKNRVHKPEIEDHLQGISSQTDISNLALLTIYTLIFANIFDPAGS